MMGKATISIPLVTLRPDGLGGFRPRYIPGKHHRSLGLKGEDLRHGKDGAWYTLDECAAWSAARQKLVAELETKSSPRARKAAVKHAAGITLCELSDKFFASPRANGQPLVEGKKRREPLSANSVRFYRTMSRQIEELDDGRLWVSPAAAISAKVLGDPDKGVLHRIEVGHGLGMARGVRAFLSTLYRFGTARGLVPFNPVTAIQERLPVPAPRVRYGSVEEMRQLIAAADLLAEPRVGNLAPARFFDVGDMIVMGLWSGQRQGDRMAIDDYKINADGMLFHQHKKHGQPLLIPEARPLAERLEAGRRRRAGWGVNYPTVLLDETHRAPWTASRYRRAFNQVRDAAAQGIAGPAGEQLLAPMPSLSDFRDQDLRDTAVTWLALADNDAIHIGSITGHSLDSVNAILRHYLGMHPELARSAIARLVAWFDQQGETNG